MTHFGPLDRVTGPVTDLHAEMKKILVVDDVHDVADSTASLLQLLGYQTRTAYDGSEAVLLAKAYLPDVVLLDLNMPVVDGFAAACEIRRHSGSRPVVLVALSALAHLSAESKLRDCGFDFWMTKPADVDALMAIVQSSAADPTPP